MKGQKMLDLFFPQCIMVTATHTVGFHNTLQKTKIALGVYSDSALSLGEKSYIARVEGGTSPKKTPQHIELVIVSLK